MGRGRRVMKIFNVSKDLTTPHSLVIATAAAAANKKRRNSMASKI